MKEILKYKNGMSLRQYKKGMYYIYHGRECIAWRMDTRKEAREMYEYLLS